MVTNQKIKRKDFPFVRINTRVRPDQAKYIKDLLKKRNVGKKTWEEQVGDADIHREMVDYYMDNHEI